MDFISFFSIILGTLIAEDLTCITSGLLAHTAKLNLTTAIVGCTTGILIGDMILYFIGRVARLSLHINQNLKSKVEKLTDKYSTRAEKQGWKLILLARFIPGLRIPVYLTFGFINTKAHKMLFFVLVAGLIWTPTLVLLSYYIGAPFKNFIEYNITHRWKEILIGILLIYLLIRFIFIFSNKSKRRSFIINIHKKFIPEYWSRTVFYFPLVPFFIYWLIKYRGPQIITLTNPCFIKNGSDVIGESKNNILGLLPKKYVLDYYLIPSYKSFANKLKGKKITLTNFLSKDRKNNFLKINNIKIIKEEFSIKHFEEIENQIINLRFKYFYEECLTKRKWKFPIVLKPDEGHRGRGVKIIKNKNEAINYFKKNDGAILAQKYHAGPFELGVLYHRHPSQKNGKIFSITKKVFPKITGDGIKSIEDLIWENKRLKFQAPLFIERIEEKNINIKEILKKGKILKLGNVGNHCQGTLFLDGDYFINDKLEKVIDKISKNIKDFYFGRFDIRFKDEKTFMKGLDFNIVELNGVTSESTNLYDPKFNLIQKYKILIKQWDTLLKIAEYNKLNNLKYKMSFIDFLKIFYTYIKKEKVKFVSD